MKSQFAKYLEETSHKRMFEIEEGFFIYQVNGKELYVQEVYVDPEFRRLGIASLLDQKAIEIAKENGCEYIKGSVITSSPKATESMKFQLSLGYKIAYSDRDIIYLIKNVGE